MRKLTRRERAEMRAFAAACPTRQAAILRDWANQSAQHDLLVDCCAMTQSGAGDVKVQA